MMWLENLKIRPVAAARGVARSLKGLLVAGPVALLALGAGALGVPALAQAPHAAQSSPEIDRAVAALRDISTLRASFVQTDAGGQRLSGTLLLKRPGKIRFQYQPGVPMLIVSDGRALTIVDKQVNQVQRWPIGKSPMGALLDPKRDVAQYGQVVRTGDPALLAVAVRDRSHPEYGVTTLFLTRKAGAPGGLELAGWDTLDAQNRLTAIRLSGHQYGMPLGDEQFRYLDTSVRPHK
ncbi:MAG TPA: outer membrane lipoprotein carrier protein LolA [Novosphingobium sp.]|nr:outer membrane lipoprotein carrier protein LolA [Novosphingobium sp.]